MLSPPEVTLKRRQRGYIARQNRADQVLWLNLGGQRAKLSKQAFKGAILLRPSKDQVFGVCPRILTQFRDAVMVQHGSGEWIRKQGVPGPPKGLHRVAVRFDDSEWGTLRVACAAAEETIWIDGYADQLTCDNGRYDWAEIEDFLRRFETAMLGKQG
jgi:hypothetical protein